jgi:hypothetical protein
MKSDRLNVPNAGMQSRNASPSIPCSEVKASIDGRMIRDHPRDARGLIFLFVGHDDESSSSVPFVALFAIRANK